MRYPTTPSRIQLSIWPAGIPGTAQGTVDWAGGMINWQDPDYVSAGKLVLRLHSAHLLIEYGLLQVTSMPSFNPSPSPAKTLSPPLLMLLLTCTTRTPLRLPRPLRSPTRPPSTLPPAWSSAVSGASAARLPLLCSSESSECSFDRTFKEILFLFVLYPSCCILCTSNTGLYVLILLRSATKIGSTCSYYELGCES